MAVVKFTLQEKTNNNLFNAPVAGKIQEIKAGQKEMEIVIATANGETKSQMVPNGLDLIVKQNQVIQADQPLTVNPNVGGFGQTETEIVFTRSCSYLWLFSICYFGYY